MRFEFHEVTEKDRDGITLLLRDIPEAFTPRGCTLCLRDVYAHNALVATCGDDLCGIVAWATFATEVEFLWLAVAKRYRRQGLATRLFEHVESLAESDRQVLLAKTADAGTLPPRLGLSRDNYRSTMAFLVGYGFEWCARIPNYFGPDNAAILMIKRLRTHD